MSDYTKTKKSPASVPASKSPATKLSLASINRAAGAAVNEDGPSFGEAIDREIAQIVPEGAVSVERAIVDAFDGSEEIAREEKELRAQLRRLTAKKRNVVAGALAVVSTRDHLANKRDSLRAEASLLAQRVKSVDEKRAVLSNKLESSVRAHGKGSFVPVFGSALDASAAIVALDFYRGVFARHAEERAKEAAAAEKEYSDFVTAHAKELELVERPKR